MNADVINELEQLLGRIFTAVIAKGYKPIRQWKTRYKFDGNGISTEVVESVDVRFTLERYFLPILDTADFTRLEFLIESLQPEVAKPWWCVSRSDNPGEFVFMMMRNIIERDVNLAGPKDLIHAELNDLSRLVTARKVTHRILWVISGLEVNCEKESWELEDGFLLRKISDEELNDIVRPYSGNEFLIRISPFVITKEVTVDLPVSILRVDHSSTNVVKRFIHALNLSKAGAFVVSLTNVKPIGYFRNVSTGYTVYPNEGLGGQVQFSRNEIELAVKRFVDLGKADLNRFELAINRLSDAELRRDPKDSIIDSVIGLESLLLNSGNESELRFRFSLHYASLFDSEQSHERERASQAYDLRSKIVHGTRIKENVSFNGATVSLHEAARDIKHMLRIALCKLMDDKDFGSKDFWLKRLLPKYN